MSDRLASSFDRAASVYDLLVNANPGYHRALRRSVRRMGLPNTGEGLVLLDAGCGTGASTAALLAAAPRARILAIDASAGMLARARQKEWPASVRFVHSRIEGLDTEDLRGGFDGILAAYLLRNLDDVDLGLRTLRGLLRPGGRLAIHEYSVRDSAAAHAMWNLVCCAIIIPAGLLTNHESSLYRHLRRSVVGFDGVRRFGARMEQAGFTGVRNATMTGWQRGIVHTFVAAAPERPR